MIEERWSYNKNYKVLCFLFSFIFMYFYLKGLETTFIQNSLDASETWKVAKTFFSSNPEHSYVMYKGLWSLVPSLISYNVENVLGLKEFDVYRLLSALSFSYITCVGVPNFWSLIIKRQIGAFRIILFVIAVFLFVEKPFTYISVDVMCVAILIMAINKALSLVATKTTFWRMADYMCLSILIALLSSFSGQYVPASICIFLYSALYLARNYSGKNLHKEILFFLTAAAAGALVIKIPDYLYIANRVMPIRNSGGWLPTASEWMKYSLTANMLYVNSPTTVLDIRGTAILIGQGINIDSIKAGAVPYDSMQHFELVTKYPVEFMLRWLNRLFIGITYNQRGNSLLLLISSYSILFMSLKTVMDHCKKITDIINPKFLIFLAWILPALVPCLMHVESRYFLGLNLLLISTAIFVSLDFTKVVGFHQSLSNTETEKYENKPSFINAEINYSMLIYLIFLVMCLMIFGALNETMGIKGDLFFGW